MPFLRLSSDELPRPAALPDVFHGTDEDHGVSPSGGRGELEDGEDGEDGEECEECGGLDAASGQTLRIDMNQRDKRGWLSHGGAGAKRRPAKSDRPRMYERRSHARGREVHRNRPHGACPQAPIRDITISRYQSSVVHCPIESTQAFCFCGSLSFRGATNLGK